MSNVVSLRDTQSWRAEFPHQQQTADTGIAELACRISSLRSKAQEDISHSILMLDLAAQHAHQIARRIGDPTGKKNFDTNIATIEQLLKIARDMALKL